MLVGAFNNEKAFSVIVKSSLRFVASSIMNVGCQTKNPCENVKIFNSGFYVRVLMSELQVTLFNFGWCVVQ